PRRGLPGDRPRARGRAPLPPVARDQGEADRRLASRRRVHAEQPRLPLPRGGRPPPRGAALPARVGDLRRGARPEASELDRLPGEPEGSRARDAARARGVRGSVAATLDEERPPAAQARESRLAMSAFPRTL